MAIPLKSKLKGIVFDGSGVITDESVDIPSRIIADRFQLPFEVVRQTIFFEDYFLANVGKLSARQFYKKCITDLNIKMRYGEFAEIYLEGNRVRPDMVTLLKSLSQKYPLFLFSNQTQINSRYLHPILDPLFKISVFSDQVRIAKPDPKIYDLLLSKIDLPPESLLYIDNMAKNLPPARERGMETYLFTTTAKLREDLKYLLHPKP